MSNLLDSPMDHSVKLWNNLFGLSKPFASMYFLTGFHRSWVWRPTACLKMVQNCSMGFIFGGFLMILLPLDARYNICLALIGYFSQNMQLLLVVPDFEIFNNVCIFRNFCFKHFWKYLKTCWFSGNSYEDMFCSKFTKLSEKLWIL